MLSFAEKRMTGKGTGTVPTIGIKIFQFIPARQSCLDWVKTGTRTVPLTLLHFPLAVDALPAVFPE